MDIIIYKHEMDLKLQIHLYSILKNTLQKKFRMFLSKDNLMMNLNLMPQLYTINIFLYLNKRLDHKNDDPQQLNIVI